MKLTEVSYGETIQVAEGHWKRFDAKVTGEGETDDELFSEVKRVVKQQIAMETGAYTLTSDNRWHPTVHPNLTNSTQTPLPEIKAEKIDPIEGTRGEIRKCSSIEDLNSLRMIVKIKYPQLKAEFDYKYAELTLSK